MTTPHPKKVGRPATGRTKKGAFLWMSKKTDSDRKQIARRFRLTLTDSVAAALAFANTHPDFRGVVPQ